MRRLKPPNPRLRSIIEKFSKEDQLVIQRKARAMAQEMISQGTKKKK